MEYLFHLIENEVSFLFELVILCVVKCKWGRGILIFLKVSETGNLLMCASDCTRMRIRWTDTLGFHSLG